MKMTLEQVRDNMLPYVDGIEPHVEVNVVEMQEWIDAINARLPRSKVAANTLHSEREAFERWLYSRAPFRTTAHVEAAWVGWQGHAIEPSRVSIPTAFVESHRVAGEKHMELVWEDDQREDRDYEPLYLAPPIGLDAVREVISDLREWGDGTSLTHIADKLEAAIKGAA